MHSQYTTFILPLATGGEEEEVLNHFLRSHRILQIRHQLVERERGADWFFLVEYQGSTSKASAERESSPVDYRDVLNPEEFERFRSLRELRKVIAERQGVPVYAVFTNRQLADIAHSCPATLQDLRAIEGIGSGKADRYGAEFLEALRALPGRQATRAGAISSGSGSPSLAPPATGT